MARTESAWQEMEGGYLQPTDPNGRNVLIIGTNKYINFNSVTGASGYGIRDNAGVIEFKNDGGAWTAIGSGGGGTPGGSDTEVQFNDGGSFGGDASFTYNKTTGTLTVPTSVNSTLRASSSAGVLFESNSGTDVALFGAGGGAGATFYGGVNIAGNLAVDTNVLFADTVNDRVGIGTTNPTAKFTIVGSSTSGDLMVTNSSAAGSISVASLLAASATGDTYFSVGRALSTANSALVGHSTVGGGNYAFITTYGRPASDFAITSAGNVGVGTSSPTSKHHIQSTSTSVVSSTIQLINSQSANSLQIIDHLGGSLLSHFRYGYVGSVLRVSEGSKYFQMEAYSADQLYFSTSGGSFRIRTLDSNPITFYTNNTVRLNIDGSTGSAHFGALAFSTAQQVAIQPLSSTIKGLVIRGATSQSATLQEWQESAGSLLALVTSAGNFSIGGSATAAARIQVNTTVTNSTTVPAQYLINAGSGNNTGTSLLLGYAASAGATSGIAGYYTNAVEAGMWLALSTQGTNYAYLSPTGKFSVGSPSIARMFNVVDSVNNYQIRMGSNTSNFTYDIGRNASNGLFYFYGNQTGAVGYVFDGINGEAMRVDVSRNLGVGTGSTVSARLHVISTTEQLRVGYDASNYFNATVSSTGGVTLNAVGSGAIFNFSDQISAPAGSVGTPSYVFGTDTNSGLYSAGDGTIAFSSNGTQKFRFDSGGFTVIGANTLSADRAFAVTSGGAAYPFSAGYNAAGEESFGFGDVITAVTSGFARNTTSGLVEFRTQNFAASDFGISLTNASNEFYVNQATVEKFRLTDTGMLRLTNTTTQQTWRYDDINSWSATTSSVGVTTFDATGASASFVFSDDVSVNAQVNTQNLYPTVNDTYYLGKNDDDTPFAWKGVILRDQVTGTYYRVEMNNGILTAVDLTD